MPKVDRVYPRACGGTPSPRGPRMTRLGLSPRLRGNRMFDGQEYEYEGSIPAPAGEPAASRGMTRLSPVYPRACGGTMAPPTPPISTSGLSPRLRGNLRRREWRRSCWRSIPAPAGEPNASLRRFSVSPVYPRACGGTVYWYAGGMAGTGLSPRLRGNLTAAAVRALLGRSIPAPAGEPNKDTGGDPGFRVYPRACGGTRPRVFDGSHQTGLSPRLRGNRLRLGCVRHCKRSIPAPAGEPLCRAAQPPAVEVYPRACGGTLPTLRSYPLCRGLSPRLRGNPRTDSLGLSTKGSIPAPAGEPCLPSNNTW